MSRIWVLFSKREQCFLAFSQGQSCVFLMVMASEWIIYVASALCQTVWAWSSAQPHTSAQLRAKPFDLGLASSSTACPLFLCHHHKAWLGFCKGNSNLPLNPPFNPETDSQTWPGRSRHADGTTATTQRSTAPFKSKAVVVLSDCASLRRENSQSSHTGLAAVSSP